MKKIVLTFVSVVSILFSQFGIVAYANDTIVIEDDESGISIETEYSSENYYLQEVDNGDSVVYQIMDKENNQNMESWEFEKLPLTRSMNNASYLHRVTNRKVFYSGVFTGTLCMELELEVYSEGSFRQIEDYYGYTTLIEGWSVFDIDTFTLYKAEPKNGNYPCLEFIVSYSAVIEATLDAEANAEYEMSLIAGGFTGGGSIGSTFYYNKLVPNTFNNKSVNVFNEVKRCE